jgi:exodeoxyribonuclease-5
VFKISRENFNEIIYKENGKPKKIGKFVLKERIGKGIKLIILDEGSMVNEDIAKNLLSFDIPIIVLGDLNQLPPVFGNPFFLTDPDVILTKIMRQNENNPIIYLSQQVLAGKELHIGDYGNSSIISKNSISKECFTKADIVLTETNRMRWNINNYFREQLKKIKQLDYPHVNEKVICRKNNWSRSISYKKIDMYMTNGMTGFVDTIDRSTYDKKSMIMDFRPDFSEKIFKNVRFNYKYMYAIPTSSLAETDSKTIQDDINDYLMDKFEYAYAITVHLSQGSQMDKVLYLHEGMMRNKEDNKKLMYTAITRAVSSVTIVI